MAKTLFICSHCDAQFPKWAGRCEECGKWGTIEQGGSAEPATAGAKHKEQIEAVRAARPLPFSDIKPGEVARASTGIGEFDRVLGGGIVPGSLTLLGGDPGIGKSTLVAQVAARIGKPVLYVSGEESAAQLKMRFDRLKIKQENIQYLGEEHVEVICKTAIEEQPALVIIDSIQTVASSAVETEPGSVNQIKASTVRFLEVAKDSNIPIMIIGHVTKGGEIGGPKALEHIVDAVLYLEGDKTTQYRILRSVKNRFGSTNEVGVFEMREQGLAEVENPSEAFIEERSEAAGSCITAVAEGSRIFLVEVQALVAKTSFGFPQRKCSGFDLNRLNVLLAVLTRRANIEFDQYDVYVNVVGGASLHEPSMDLAVCLALVSALKDTPLKKTVASWGEIGLGGELRTVSRHQDRAKEAKRFGFTDSISSKDIKTLPEALKKAGL